MTRIIARGMLSLGAFGLMLGLFEVGFRLAGYRPIYEIYSKPSIFWRHDDVLGWSHTPGSIGVYRGPRPWPIEFENEVRINSLGLRGPEVHERREGDFRILFLGDSVVAGFEVAESETFVARVGKKLNDHFDFPVETINAGVRGYGTDQSYLYYQRDGRKLRPDLVIFHHSTNDPRNNMTLHRTRRPFGKGAFALEADGSLRAQGIPVPEYPMCSQVGMDGSYRIETVDTIASRAWCALEMNLADRSALFTWATHVLRDSPALLRWLYQLGSQAREVARAGAGAFAPGVARAAEEGAGDDPAAMHLTRAILVAMKNDVEASGASFLLWISHPELDLLGRDEIEASGIEVLHTIRVLEGGWRVPLTFRNDSHWNANGHRIVADLLAEKLEPRIQRMIAERPTPPPTLGKAPARGLASWPTRE